MKAYLKAHRLAWFFVYGEWPQKQIDHINGNKSDNRISNLRLATASQNLSNKGITKSNTSGYKGVSFNRTKKKWMASIKVNKKSINLGYFLTPEEASEAYKAAAIKHHGEFASW